MEAEIRAALDILQKLGKEPSECELWLGLLPAMEAGEQQELLHNLQSEITLLQSAG